MPLTTADIIDLADYRRTRQQAAQRATPGGEAPTGFVWVPVIAPAYLWAWSPVALAQAPAQRYGDAG